MKDSSYTQKLEAFLQSKSQDITNMEVAYTNGDYEITKWDYPFDVPTSGELADIDHEEYIENKKKQSRETRAKIPIVQLATQVRNPSNGTIVFERATLSIKTWVDGEWL